MVMVLPAYEGGQRPSRSFLAARDWLGQRLDAVCKITVEGKKIVRGVIISVPKM
jgi:hypothetical protein